MYMQVFVYVFVIIFMQMESPMYKPYKLFSHMMFLKHQCVLVHVDYITDILKWSDSIYVPYFCCTHVQYIIQFNYWIIKLPLFSFITISKVNILIFILVYLLST